MQLQVSAEPKNIQAVQVWLRDNRPDLVGHFETILKSDATLNSSAQSMLGLSLIGFEAGRMYQHDNSEYAPGEYASIEGAPNVEAIRAWCTKHRADMNQQIDRILMLEENADPVGQATFLLLAIGFEAGRTFQASNPTMAINDPSLY